MAARREPSTTTTAAKRAWSGARSAAYRAGVAGRSRAVNRVKTAAKKAGRSDWHRWKKASGVAVTRGKRGSEPSRVS